MTTHSNTAAQPPIVRPEKEDLATLAELWEASVRVSHDFVTEEDIQYYKPLVREIYLPAVELYIIRDRDGSPAAFTGLSDDKVEMLFVHPESMGKGYGTRLLEFAVREKGIRRLDVNEQNGRARAFYKGKGFRVVGRDALDPQGKPLPILHLEYEEQI